ncbi:flagellar biosynthesis protein FlhF [Jeotgalibacillus proteolyticus]|uniref:Flagellar biosynthesis protein FlhF n=1 Tax=Jeotgalibacillus proteolyticus TaxID=2082395 RepID=A0A2S5GG85_9BACL|nr:flagellar biosynthesis protein FlhF [Jeotgalibacillus proteolyticus]PPA72042.1 flagellar biosynthesis protein FlhF [Jeotgalibacillus proteolyticus]
MKMKKITAPTLPAAMNLIRAEFGSDAVVLSSKTVHTGGFLGLFKKKQIQVIAGLDETHAIPAAAKEVVKEQKREEGPEKAGDSFKHLEELKELKKMVSTLTNQSDSKLKQFPLAIKKELHFYQEQDFDESWLFRLGSYLYGLWEKDPLNIDLAKKAEEYLKEQLTELSWGSSFEKYIAVLGPTGVGKTTTLAKMAANLVIHHNKRVAFITTDTYRIGAIEQLKTYAKLLDVPLEVVYGKEDFERAIEKFQDYDHIFIDTAGRNYRHSKYVDDLKDVFVFPPDMQCFLVLSITAKKSDMQQIIDRFKEVEIEQFIFTKWDESQSAGPVFHVMLDNQKGAAYFTSGQEVPEDIIKASADSFVELTKKSGLT